MAQRLRITARYSSPRVCSILVEIAISICAPPKHKQTWTCTKRMNARNVEQNSALGKNFKHKGKKKPCNPLLDKQETDDQFRCKRCGQGFSQAASMYCHMKKACKLRLSERVGELKDCIIKIQEQRIEELKATRDYTERKNPLADAEARTEETKNSHHKKLPAALRNAVWNKYIGPKMGEGMCFCCNLEPILRSNYECGHVQSRSKGGNDKLDNLRPVCSCCNKSMGAKNMIDFADECGFTMREVSSIIPNSRPVRDKSSKMSNAVSEDLYPV